MAWLAVEDGYVRVTFYFAERPRAVLLPVTFEVRDRAGLALVGAVLSVKLAAR